MATRKRNFEINKIYLEWQKGGLLDILVFSKDDCAQYGFNVQEAVELETSGAYVKTGADEIPLSLLARMIGGNIHICPVFLEPEYKNLISNYEDISIEKSVQGQLELAGCEISDEENADILLIINNFEKNQGEIVMKIDTKSFGRSFKVPDKSYMAADVRFANGADNNFVNELLFNNKISDETFYGYSGWNTSANTLGSLIFAAKTKFFAKKEGCRNSPIGKIHENSLERRRCTNEKERQQAVIDASGVCLDFEQPEFPRVCSNRGATGQRRELGVEQDDNRQRYRSQHKFLSPKRHGRRYGNPLVP